MMGSFNDYLMSLKDTPEYIQAKIDDDITNAIFERMEARGVSEEELSRETQIPPLWIPRILAGDVSLFDYDLCLIAHALNCDVKVEIVPKERAGE